MNQAFAVEINENIEQGFERFAAFGSRQRTQGDNLGEVFFGILQHDVKTVSILKAATADVQDAHQIGMSQLRCAAPKRELDIRGGTGGNEFDGRFLSLRTSQLGEENGGVVRTSQVLPQPESIVDDLTFAQLPDITHVAPPTANSCEPANGGGPNGVACNRPKNAAASKAELEGLDVRFAGAWGRALVAHILA